MRIAVIATSFNRREKTFKAFSNLSSNKRYDLDFYLCDDASTDGTAAHINEHFENAKVLQGTGDLFWSRGMYVAMEAAEKKDYDFYLMINDDVVFFPDAIDTMIKSYQLAGESCGIVGSTCDTDGEKTTYGGKIINGKSLLVPNGSLQQCDLANWNCFLIDRNIIRKIGLIDNKYEHAHGDYDYSLMMKRSGYNIFIATKHIGNCERNSPNGTHFDKNVSPIERLNLLFSKRGEPIKSGVYYRLKNFESLGMTGFRSLFGYYLKCIIAIIKVKDFQ